MKLLRHYRIFREEEGSSLIEFAFSIVIVMAMILTILSASLLMYFNHFIANAAREGARYSIVRGSSWTDTCSTAVIANCIATPDTVSAYVKGFSTMKALSTNLVVATTWSGTDASGGSGCGVIDAHSPGCIVTVKVTYSSQILSLPLVPVMAPTLTSSSTMTILY